MSSPTSTAEVMADLARRVAAIGWGAPAMPKSSHYVCHLCGHSILEGRAVFMLQDRPYCCTRHRAQACTDIESLQQRRILPSLQRSASSRAFPDTAIESLFGEWRVCD